MTLPRILHPLHGDGWLSRLGRKLTDFRRLRREEGGNVMVLYIAAALLLIAMLWAIIGTGARLVQKETLQTSADAAAFSAAAIKAKGMNLIAFCNLLMALLLAIIIILRLLKDALILAGLLLTAAAFLPPDPFLAGLAAQVDTIATDFANVESNIEKGILQAMNGISKFERAIAKAVPALAEAEAMHVGMNGAYHDNFGSGLVAAMVPVPWDLPVQDGTWADLCNHAKDQISKILDWAVSKVVGPTLASWVTKAFQMIAGPFEDAVCGGGGSVTPSSDVAQSATCDQCMQDPGDVTLSTWNTTIQGDAPGTSTFTSKDPGGAFPEGALCGSDAGPLTWNNITYDHFTFTGCMIKKTQNLDSTNADMQHPKPLELKKDWQQDAQVRAITVLWNSNMQERRQSVGVARHAGAGAAPMLNQTMTFAQAEFFSANGHNDLWHMDWRAHLVPFTFGQASSTPGVGGAIQNFLNSPEGTALQKQFLIH